MTGGAPRRVLVTGGAGFIGSHLVEALLLRGDRVTVVDDLSTGREENLAAIRNHPALRVVRGSVAEDALVGRLVAEADVVAHLAAAVGVRLIVEQPVHTIHTNVACTDLVLRHARVRGAKVLVASTSEVYGKSSKIPFAEEDDMVLGPTTRARWSYACSKAIDEFLALAYHRAPALPTVVVRFFNTVGPRQVGQYGMVVPRFVRQALAGEPITVYGDGTQRRCFCDVSDVVGAVVALLEAPGAVGRVFNVGSDEEISIRGLAERVRARVGRDVPIRLVPYEEAYGEGFEDMPRRVPDLSRIQALIGYRPRIALDGILDRVIAHERARGAAAAPAGS